MTARAGDIVPSLSRTLRTADLVAYAGATWDWHQMHYDRDFTDSRQLAGPVVDGQMFGALIVQQLQDWFGPRSFVRSLSFSFRTLVFAGETVRCEAHVGEVWGNKVTIRGRVVVVDAEGGVARVAVDPVSAEVMVGVADGPGAAR